MDAERRRALLEEIAADPQTSTSDRLKAFEQMDRLRPDGREFTAADVDDLSNGELDALFAEEVSVRDSAARLAEEIIGDDARFREAVEREAARMTEQAHAEARKALRRAEQAEEALREAWASNAPRTPPTAAQTASGPSPVPVAVPAGVDLSSGWGDSRDRPLSLEARRERLRQFEQAERLRRT